jgi:hypothetical protein
MSSHSLAKTSALREQALHECIAMTRYALASGMAVPPALVNAIEAARFAPADKPMDMAPIVKAHDQLAKLVAPATPRALLVMGDEHNQNSRLAWVGSVGLVRRMMGAAVVSVLLFITLSITSATTLNPIVGTDATAASQSNSATPPASQTTNSAASASRATGRFPTPEDSQGWPLLANELFWMAAAGIGASFALLRQVNDFIVARTYDPKYEPTYWIKFLLGVMAGFILAALLPGMFGGSSTNPGSGPAALAVPTLAMLGGFSASAVFRILTKLVESVENVFRDSPRDEAVQREKAAQTKAGEELSATRMNVAGQLVRLQQQLATGADSAALSAALGGILHSLVPAAAPADGAAPEPPAGTVSLPNTPIVAAPGTPVSDEPAASVEPSPAPEPAEPADEPAAAGDGGAEPGAQG